MSKQIIPADLQQFLRSELLLDKKLEINLADDIGDDYGVCGDDADDFMDHFAHRFSVEAGDFDLSRYFNPEGVDFLGISFFLGLFLKSYRRSRKTMPITVEMLIHAINLGKWDTALIERECHHLTEKARQRYISRLL